MHTTPTPSRTAPPMTPLNDWDQPREAIRPLPGQVGLFEYGRYLATDGQDELCSIPAGIYRAQEQDQRLLWDLEA